MRIKVTTDRDKIASLENRVRKVAASAVRRIGSSLVNTSQTIAPLNEEVVIESEVSQEDPFPKMTEVGEDVSYLKEETQPQYQLVYEPDLLPPLELLKQEGILVLEEWFRWAEEWSMLLRVYGNITRQSKVLEIGCGLGRIAFPLRFILSSEGSYEGFEICREKVEFLEQNFHRLYPNFNFTWANLHNTYYNPEGDIQPYEYTFPYADNSFDVIYAASVFTHLLPEVTARYLKEAARVLKPGGRCVFSFFLLDNYLAGRPRPQMFELPVFNFDHAYGDYGDEFAIGQPDNPEEMTAYRLSLIESYAEQAQLKLVQPPVPGLWSASSPTWVGAQDLVILTGS